jgi:hypothetical protein
MSNKSASLKHMGHGKVICSKCRKVIVSCRCIGCSDSIQYDVCDQCEKNETR